MDKKYVLVLSGGGFKGAFQVGAINYILNNEIEIEGEKIKIDKFDIITGVSVGCLNGAMVATNQVTELNDLWFNQIANNGPGIIHQSKIIDAAGIINGNKIIGQIVPKLGLKRIVKLMLSKKARKRLGTQVVSSVKGFSLSDNSPLITTISKYVNKDKLKGIRFKLGFVNLERGEYVCKSADDFKDDENLYKAIQASSCMPIIWHPTMDIEDKDGNHYKTNVDGGLRDNSPLKDAIDEMAKDPEDTEHYVIVISCHPEKIAEHKEPFNTLSVASRSLLEITLAEIFQNDISRFIQINDILKKVGKDSLEINGKKLRRFKVKVVQPKESLRNNVDATKETLEWRKGKGYKRAQKVLSSNTLQNWV